MTMTVIMDTNSVIIAVVYIFVVIVSSEDVDPCASYEPLPRATYRGGECAYEQGKEVCDTYLNSSAWYQAEGLSGYLTMQESPADFLTCGTKFPIWMNGSHPTVAEGEVERQACQTNIYDTCFQSRTIKVKNCGSFFVYQLSSAGACPEGYCFGENDPCPPFDPCDFYEHTAIEYDSARSTSCVISDVSTCDSVESSTWYKFNGDSGYLTVASSCPTGTTCGAQSPLWINGTGAENTNGTRSNTVCVRSGDECCAQTFTIESKQCTGFTVYHFSEELTGQCFRYCTDDASATCPSTPTTTSTSDVTTVDPCTSYEPLPRAAYRGGECAYEQGKEVCDTYLNSSAWYQAEGLSGYLTMQESPADFLTCGTKFPIWMNGSHPTVAEGEVERQACQTNIYDTCFESSTIKVKNCGSFFVYQLSSAGACPEGYCFGENDPCPPFDPCDFYEHTAIEYDSARSTSCVISDVSTCDSVESSTWYKFNGDSGYLTVASSCPTGTTCGAQSPLWINGTGAENTNGTRSNTVCVRSGDECCAQTFTIESKQCTGFTVYHFSEELTGQCFRYCTDDATATCPSMPTSTSTNGVTTGTKTRGNQNHPESSETKRDYKWLIPAVVITGVIGLAIGAVVTYAIIKHKMKEKVGNSMLFDDIHLNGRKQVSVVGSWGNCQDETKYLNLKLIKRWWKLGINLICNIGVVQRHLDDVMSKQVTTNEIT